MWSSWPFSITSPTFVKFWLTFPNFLPFQLFRNVGTWQERMWTSAYWKWWSQHQTPCLSPCSSCYFSLQSTLTLKRQWWRKFRLLLVRIYQIINRGRKQFLQNISFLCPKNLMSNKIFTTIHPEKNKARHFVILSYCREVKNRVFFCVLFDYKNNTCSLI